MAVNKMKRHLGTVEAALPADVCDLVLELAGKAGKIKLWCAALLDDLHHGICPKTDVLWAVFCSAWCERLADCCLDIMLHPAAPIPLTCGTRYCELLYGFIEPFHDRFTEGVQARVPQLDFDTALFQDDRVRRAYFLTVDPNQRLPISSTSTLSGKLKTSSAHFRLCFFDTSTVVCACLKSYFNGTRMGWHDARIDVDALRSLYENVDRVSLSTSGEAFALCIRRIWSSLRVEIVSRPVLDEFISTLRLLLTLDPRLRHSDREDELERCWNAESARHLRGICEHACMPKLFSDVEDTRHTAYAFLCDQTVWKSAAGRVCWKRSGADQELLNIIQRGRSMQASSQHVLSLMQP